MVDVTPPNLLNFSIPTEIDLNNLGGNKVTFNVEATDKQGGSGIEKVIITLDRSLSAGNRAYFSNVVAGKASADGQLTTSDTFTDGTATTANVSYSVGPGTPAGIVTVESIWVLDNANHVTIYDTTQLAELGFNTKVTLTNTFSPSAPSAAIVSSADAGSTPTFAGSSPAGSTVYLTAFFDGEWINLGSTTAGSDGKWSLQAKRLADGTYVKATAWEVDSHGNASALSTSFSFDVWSSGIAAPSLVVPEDAQGKVHTANPVVTGTAAASAEVTLFADGNKIGTGRADNNGHWAVLSNDLSNGAHSITATQTTTAGTTSAASITSNVVVDVQPNIGLHFTVASATGPNGVAADAGYIQKMLNDIGARLNEFIDTNQKLSVKVSVDSLKDGAVASAAAGWLESPRLS